MVRYRYFLIFWILTRYLTQPNFGGTFFCAPKKAEPEYSWHVVVTQEKLRVHNKVDNEMLLA